MIDRAKRKTLKNFAISGMGVTASTYIPLAFSGDTPANLAVDSMPDSGLSLTHYANFNGHTLLIRNSSERAIALRNVYPNVVATPAGEVDLRDLLREGELSIDANTTQAVSITKDRVVTKYARWQHVRTDGLVNAPFDRYQSIKVTGRYNIANDTKSTRLHIARIV